MYILKRRENTKEHIIKVHEMEMKSLEDGRRKIRICLTIMLIAAVISGVCYYSAAGKAERYESEETLVNSEEKCNGC